MKISVSPGRWNEILDFILEISKGNFSLRISMQDNMHPIETLVMMLNNMIEEINTLLHHIKPSESYPVTVQFVIIFNKEFQIKHISQELLKTLNRECNFKDIILTDLIDSKTINKISQSIRKSPSIKEEIDFPISFITEKKLLFHADAKLLGVKNECENLFILNIVKILYRNDQLEKLIRERSNGKIPLTPSKHQALLLQENRELAEKVEDLIMRNLNNKMPKLQYLSEKFCASPSKLHKAFKYYYGTNISQYHNQKRLENAHLLLLETEMSVIKVALECGFKSTAHFSRKFKKQYGYSPSSTKNQQNFSDFGQQLNKN